MTERPTVEDKYDPTIWTVPAIAEAERLQALNADLVAALEACAEWGRCYAAYLPDSHPVTINLGDLRQLSAALAKAKN
jgi:hypothetical protein